MAENQSTPSTTEEWRPIPGWEGLYEVSCHGQVRSVGRVVVRRNGVKQTVRARLLKQIPTSPDYLYVSLYQSGTKSNIRVQVLVLAAFKGPRPDGAVIRHKNDIGSDNRLANLEYGTQSENMHDKVKNGNDWNAKKEFCPRGHVLVDPNLVNAKKSKGWRNCKSCHRARSFVRHYAKQGMDLDIQIESDRYFAKIMNK